MHGGKRAQAGVGAPADVLHKAGIGLSCIGEVPEPGLLREGVGVQPVQQFQIHAEAPVGVLGRVDVEIGETRQDQMSGIIQEGKGCIGLWYGVKDTGAASVQTEQIAARHGTQGVGVDTITEIALQEKRGSVHDGAPLSLKCEFHLFTEVRRGPGSGKLIARLFAAAGRDTQPILGLYKFPEMKWIGSGPDTKKPPFLPRNSFPTSPFGNL